MAEAAIKESSRVNGVPVEDLHETIRAVRGNPELGRASFSATNKWLGQGLNETEIGTFHCAGEDRTHVRKFVFRNDEPHVLLGKDEGANPVEFVLHALAGCVTTTTVYHAAARGIKIDELETTLEGDLDLQGLLQTDPSVPSGYQNIRVKMNIKSDADEKQLAELKQFFAYSPVFDTLTRAVKVDVDVNVK